ncbi:MAG: isoprenylcysteine carboxylmethyltransferase family protein [Eubacteriaceae bacterium]|nr:isoprenylcysteine carboxylmethyltransferase family protein [Eubacteriaceae bacterium]
MEQKNTKKRGAVTQAIKIIIQRLIGFALFIAAAGTIIDIRGNIFFIVYFASSVIAVVVLLNGNQDVLNAREQKQENAKVWDKILVLILVLLSFFGIYLVAGFGARFAWARLSDIWLYIGYVFLVPSYIFTLWPMMVNRHLEGYVRIQNDREHKVISSGPYSIVRHPTYLGSITGIIAIALIFGTIPIAITAAIIIAIVITRTHFEDTTLKKELDGYLAYSDKVKYRLFPLLW